MGEKKRTGLDWEDVRFFTALARHGSLSAAARLLGVNHATVSRRIAALEGSIGAQLFERRPSGYELTADGRAVLSAAAEMENAALSLTLHGQVETISGLVRIAATPSLAECFLVPRLKSLTEAHPDLDVELLADRRVVSLNRHEADIALRLGRPEQSELIGQRVVTLRFGLYATPEVRNAFTGTADARFIGFDETGAHLPEAVWLRRQVPDLRLAFRGNGQMGQAAAARAGLGIAVLPHFIGASDPALVAVPFAETPPSRELWMLTRNDSQRIARLQVVKAFLVELFATNKALFAGR
jgi:molybdate transport repressor ModE-like protein